MSMDAVLPILFRWIHIVAAILAIGGAAFARIALHPAIVETLDEGSGSRLREAVARRWRVEPALACVALDDLQTGASLLRAVRPEAEVVCAIRGKISAMWLTALRKPWPSNTLKKARKTSARSPTLWALIDQAISVARSAVGRVFPLANTCIKATEASFSSGPCGQ